MALSDSSWFQNAFWQRLYGLFGRSEEPLAESGDPARGNGLVITLCIVSSLLLWFFSSMGEIYTHEIPMQVEVSGIPDNLVLSTAPPETVLVHVQAEGLQLLQLYYNPPLLNIDGSKNQVSLESAVLQQLPPDVQIDNISHSTVVLQKEEKVTRKIPIQLVHAISVPSTHDLTENFRIDPDSVTISGPKNLVEQLTFWPTLRYTNDAVMDTLSVEVALLDTLDALIDLDIRKTRLTAVAEQFTEGSKRVNVYLQGIPSSSRTVSLEPEQIEVRYRVPLSQFGRVENATDLFATVAYNDIRADTTGFIIPVLVLPEDVIFKDVEMIPRDLRYFDILQEDE